MRGSPPAPTHRRSTIRVSMVDSQTGFGARSVIASEVSESNLVGGHSRLASILRSSGAIATHFRLLHRMGLVICTSSLCFFSPTASLRADPVDKVIFFRATCLSRAILFRLPEFFVDETHPIAGVSWERRPDVDHVRANTSSLGRGTHAHAIS
jgi:hypothetical protein